MTGETSKNNGEQLSGVSTRDILSALKGRKDLGQHVESISKLLEIASEPIVETPTPEIQPLQKASESNKEHEPFPTQCRPFCQTKIFAKTDSTDFVQVNPPYQIGEREEFWQKGKSDFMGNVNQNPPVPCHEVNFYNMIVASRVHSTEGLVAKINSQQYRLDRPFDQIVGKEFKINDINKALEAGQPWFTSLIEQPFPIFALGTENSDSLTRHFNEKSALDVDVIPITASYITQSRDVDNQVKQYLVDRLTNVDLSNGHQLWSNNYLTDRTIRALATTVSTWLEGVAKKTYNKPTVLVQTPWGSESPSKQAYLNALFGQTVLHLLYPTVIQGIEFNEKTDLKQILSKLPSFSTSPIRYSNISMLSNNEYAIRSGFSHGGSPILSADSNTINDSSKQIENELHRLKDKPWEEALQEWKTTGLKILSNIR